MQFLVDAARGAAESVGDFISPGNIVSKCLWVGEVSVVAFRTIESAVVYPRATLFGACLNLTVGSRGPVALAAQVVLVMRKTLELINQAKEVAKEARWLVRAFTGSYPIPLHWLKQKESYAVETRQSFWVQFLCYSPECITETTLRSDLVLGSVLRLVTKTMRLSFTFFELGLGVFISPLTQNMATSMIFSNCCEISKSYHELQQNPISLLQELEENSSFADEFFSRFGANTTVSLLTSALRSGIRTIAPYQPAISSIFHRVMEHVQEGTFFLTNMTTGLEIAPLGLPQIEQTQPTSAQRTSDVNFRCIDPTCKGKHARGRERFFSAH